MNTNAIHQALRLYKYPQEMAWLCFPDSEHPDGMTDLLLICASNKRLEEFCEKYHHDPEALKTALLNFLKKAVLIEDNATVKQLALNSKADSELRKTHYQLLMKIFHPDRNESPEADYYSSMITKANDKLQNEQKLKGEADHTISVTESRNPPKSFYTATQTAETQISSLRTAFAFVAALFVITLVAIVGHFNDPANPDLITQKTDTENINSVAKTTTDIPQTETQTSEIAAKPQFIMTGIDKKPLTEKQISNSQLQQLLRNLETAYERGDVDKIKPILANTPDLQNQTDEELSQKLSTLFEITNNRKMVLYEFDWIKVSNQIKGKGKFLSRYHLVGEEKWLTREGIAKVVFEPVNGKIQITQVVLENFTID